MGDRRMAMRHALIALTAYGSLAASMAAVPLAAFDGSDLQTDWSCLLDPVMGGRSTGDGYVNKTGKFLVFEGDVVDVPSLKAPGFIAIQSQPGKYPDASSAFGGDLILTVRSSTPEYPGWKVTFNSGSASPKYSCAGGGSIPFSRGCFKARFAVPAGAEWSTVRIPFDLFSDKWDAATGNQTATCADDKSVCPTADKLAKIQMLEFMAEGTAGKAHLEIQSISAGTQ